jgi:hypothetical protein
MIRRSQGLISFDEKGMRTRGFMPSLYQSLSIIDSEPGPRREMESKGGGLKKRKKDQPERKKKTSKKSQMQNKK